jgi:hypothetical protein
LAGTTFCLIIDLETSKVNQNEIHEAGLRREEYQFLLFLLVESNSDD